MKVVRSNNTYMNILSSFAWLYGQKPLESILLDASEQGVANVMIDSGAFTLFNGKTKREWLNLDNYCKYIEKHGNKIQKYVMLDVVGNERMSKRNYEEMIRRGLNPMFVFTMNDNDYSYLEDAVRKNRNVCVAGGVTTKGDWIKQRFQRVHKKTGALIHGLGYVTYPDIYRLPIKSIDSSSWIQGSRMYGNIPYFDNGLKNLSYKDILTNKKKIPHKVRLLLEKFKVTPKMFSNIEFHRGIKGIGFMMSIVAYIEFQKLSKSCGIDLFLAVTSKNEILSLLYVNEHYKEGTLSYENFRKAR